MAKYSAKVGEWITPSETSGSIQNLGNSPIEISSVDTENTGIRLESGQMVNFDGTVYVRSIGNRASTFTTVPFKVIAGGGEGGGGGSYTLPTASSTVKGGIKVGDRLSISSEKLSADIQITSWESGKSYKSDDIVFYNNKFYRCLVAHTSGINFSDDISNWHPMYADISLWSSSTYYNLDTFVIYDNILYRCNTIHTSGSTFDNSKWDKIGENFVVTLDDWATNVEYTINQIVYYGNSIYRCKINHISTVFSDDISKWEQIYTDIKEWESSIYYPVGTIVIYNNSLYSCSIAHTSSSSFDSSKWIMLSGASTVSSSSLFDWESNKEYKINDTVYYDNNIYRCIVAHTSSSSFDISKFQFIVSTSEKILDWEANKSYKVNDVVYTNNSIYRCISNHISTSTFDSTKWEQISNSSSTTEIKTWNTGERYIENELVIYNDLVYRCKDTHISGTHFDMTKFSKIGSNYASKWLADESYVEGDTVEYDGNFYRCIESHISSPLFLDDSVKWQILGAVVDWKPNTVFYSGQLIRYNGDYYLVASTFTSSVDFDSTYLSPLIATMSWKPLTAYGVDRLIFADDGFYRCKESHMSGSSWDDSERLYWEEITFNIKVASIAQINELFV